MPICVARHGAREDYACKARGVNWQLEHAERPWDPPLTEGGVQQGVALGAGLKAHCERLGLPPVSRVICSPLIRCVQTASAAATQLGVPLLSLEPGLAEGMLEHWYRSWGVPGADSTWGGPAHCPLGAEVDPAKLHPACHVAAATLLLQPADAAEALAATQPALAEAVKIDLEYAPLEPAAENRWPAFETEQEMAARMKRTLLGLEQRYKGETILACSHGGPSAAAYAQLLEDRAETGLVAGYTALYIFVRAEDGRWQAPVAADQGHLGGDAAAAMGMPHLAEPLGGPNDGKEQTV